MMPIRKRSTATPVEFEYVPCYPSGADRAVRLLRSVVIGGAAAVELHE